MGRTDEVKKVYVEARQKVDFLADHIQDPELRASFLATALAQKALSALR